MFFTLAVISVLKLSYASLTDHFTLKFGKGIGTAAEKTSILNFFKYNFVSLNIDFNRI